MPKHFIEEGNSEALPVIFLHGLPFSSEMWTEQLKVAGEKYRAIAYDIAGCGKNNAEGPYSIESHVDDLLALMDSLNISKAVGVGLSMGGYILLRALERNPDRFMGLVLCDTKSEMDTNDDKIKRFGAVKNLMEEGVTSFAAHFLKRVFTPESFERKGEKIEKISKIIESTPPKNIASNLLALAARTDTTHSLVSIKIPTLILVGEKDLITPPKDSESMHKKISGSEFHVIPNAGHLSNLDNPYVFNEKMMDFLSRIVRNESTMKYFSL